MNFTTSKIIKEKRKKKGLTQLQLANLLNVSDRTISKWERGVGLPDISILNELSKILQISIETLLEGSKDENKIKSINSLKSKLYYCNKCNNIIHSYIDIDVFCCGTKITSLILNKNNYKYPVNIGIIDNQVNINIKHPMKKDNYISFIFSTRFDKILITKLYPEQNLQINLPQSFKNHYLYDTKLGLFKI